MRIEVSGDDNGTSGITCQWVLIARQPIAAAPLPPPAPLLQLQFHGISRFPSCPKITGDEGETLQLCFKLIGKMPSGIDVHLSRNAAGLEQGAAPNAGTLRAVASLWRCPKPGALLGVEKLELPFPDGSRCPCPAGTFPFASFHSGRSRAACLLLSHLRLQHLKGQEKHRFRMWPKWIHCGLCPFSIVGASPELSALGERMDLPGALGQHPSISQHHASSLQWDVSQDTALYLTFPNSPELLRC